MFDKLKVEEKVLNLDYSDLVEASSYFLMESLEISNSDDVSLQFSKISNQYEIDFTDISSLITSLQDNREGSKLLMQFVLLEAISRDESNLEKIENIIKGTALKQMVPEIALAIGLSSLAVMYLISQTKGKIEDKREFSIQENPDGTFTLLFREETKYVDVSTALGKLIEFFMKIPWQ